MSKTASIPSPYGDADKERSFENGDSTLSSKVSMKERSIKWIKSVKSDVSNLSVDAKSRTSYALMENDSMPLFGLKDWSVERWKDEIMKCSDQEICCLRDLLSRHEEGRDVSVGSEDGGGALRAARAIKEIVSRPLLMDEWTKVVMFQNRRLNAMYAKNRKTARVKYLENTLCSTALFRREFPLGVDSAIFDSNNKWSFAVKHSGLRRIHHKSNKAITIMLFSVMSFIILAGFGFLLYYMIGKEELWSLDEGTVQNHEDPEFSIKLNRRTKERGTVASILASLTFSLSVNAAIDAVGLIDPSTSTVFIGMLLGNTFGFVLDNTIGSDEGFREYKWDTFEGIKYGIGSLGTSRYARYLITIVFDMFFTVIFFKLLYARVVMLAGFSAKGREWLANGMCSFFISFLTYQVYANMTRFEWAYPSGVEDLRNQWISGQTMILFVVAMNMTYLVTETRTKIGERGINDPPVKLLVTICTFLGLFGLQVYEVVDPSILDDVNGTDTSQFVFDTHRPLPGVCYTKGIFKKGLAVLTIAVVGCIGFVVFVTSKQTLTGLKQMFSFVIPSNTAVSPVGESDRDNVRSQTTYDERDHTYGKIALFFAFVLLSILIVVFFSVVPFYAENGTRNTTGWYDVCQRYVKHDRRSLSLSLSLSDASLFRANYRGDWDELRRLGL